MSDTRYLYKMKQGGGPAFFVRGDYVYSMRGEVQFFIRNNWLYNMNGVPAYFVRDRYVYEAASSSCEYYFS
jgi:hypothetical protein